MLYSRWILAALMLAAPLFADDVKKEKKVTAIPAAPIMAPAAKAPADAATEIKELTTAYNKALQEYYKPYREARAKGEQYKLDPRNNPRTEYSRKFAEIAKKYAGQDAAVDAWVMVLRTGGNRKAAAEVLLRDHIGSKKMNSVVRFLRYEANGDALLRQVIEKSPHREVKGFTMLLRGETMLRKGDKNAEAVLTEAAEKYGDVSISGGRHTVGSKARGNLFEARNLTVGKTAPDIEGEDIDGVVFKLSDYRGKVILLDFWGDW